MISETEGRKAGGNEEPRSICVGKNVRENARHAGHASVEEGRIVVNTKEGNAQIEHPNMVIGLEEESRQEKIRLDGQQQPIGQSEGDKEVEIDRSSLGKVEGNKEDEVETVYGRA